MIKNRLSALRRRSRNEEGFSIAEALIAAVIIIITLTATVMATQSIFETQSMNESRNRAVALAQGRISVAQNVAFREIGFPESYKNKSKVEGGLGGVTEYNDEPIRFFDDSNGAGGTIDLMLGFDVMPYEEVVVGETELNISTYVTKIPANRFDGYAGAFDPNQDLGPLRVTVVVDWETRDGPQNVVRSIVRHPAIDECAPYTALDEADISTIPEGCKR